MGFYCKLYNETKNECVEEDKDECWKGGPPSIETVHTIIKKRKWNLTDKIVSYGPNILYLFRDTYWQIAYCVRKEEIDFNDDNFDHFESFDDEDKSFGEWGWLFTKEYLQH